MKSGGSTLEGELHARQRAQQLEDDTLAERTAEPGSLPENWPPHGAEPIDVSAFYTRLSDQGYGYGPTFQGLRSAWRLGGDVYAEVALPEGSHAEDFGLHPALLDAVLHAIGLLGGDPTGEDPVRLPFSWSDVALHAVGATRVRARIRPAGASGDEGGPDDCASV